jgi:shikimate kinase
MKVFLTGFTGVGKSTLGKELAELTGFPWVDLDAEIEKSTGISVSAYFDKHREEAFRVVERKILLEIIANRTTEIISLGGGTICHRLNHKEILAAGTLVYLDMEWDDLYKRIKSLENRPTLAKKSEEEVKAIFTQREPFYALAQLKMPINSTFTAQKLANILKLSTIR